MKKLIIGTLVTLGVVSYTFAQGQVQLFNSSSATSKIFSNSVAGGQSPTTQVGGLIPGNATQNFMFALFINSATNSATLQAPSVASSATPWTAAGGWNFANAYATNGALGGRITGAFDGGAGFATLSGIAGVQTSVGTIVNLELVGWNTLGGTITSLASFINAYNANTAGLLYGYSAVSNVKLGDNNATVPNSNVFGTIANGNLVGFTLAPIVAVPEPGTMVLAGLGGLAMLGLRRKK